VTVPSNTTVNTPQDTSTTNTATSNQLNNNSQVSVTVTENATATAVGDTIAITAQASNNQSGLTVTFYNNGVQIGTAVTNNSGQAIYNFIRNDNSSYTFSAKVTT